MRMEEGDLGNEGNWKRKLRKGSKGKVKRKLEKYQGNGKREERGKTNLREFGAKRCCLKPGRPVAAWK